MRPPRADIAAPPFPPAIEWVGGDEPRLERLVAGGPLLVHFFDLAQLNSARALPYVGAWNERYRDDGLSVLGVHSSRFPFTADTDLVAASLPRLGIEWPVAVDSKHAIWRAYGVQGWPSLFLWSRGGALRWYHLGEGEYEATELAIREAIEEARTPGREAEEVADMRWPAPLEPLRPGDEPGAEVIIPTDEHFPGGDPGTPLPAGERLEMDYEGGGAFVAAAGDGEIAFAVDGNSMNPVPISHPGLHALVVHDRHEAHRLRLDPDPGVRVYSVQFPPAPPG